MDVITPLHNLPNLKKRQNGEEVALEIYDIVLDVKAHLPPPKETAVHSLFFIVPSSLIVIGIAAIKLLLLIRFYYFYYI